MAFAPRLLFVGVPSNAIIVLSMPDLVGYGHTENLLRNHLIDILHGFQYSLAAVTALIAVTQFERLVFARRCSRRHGRTAESAAGGGYFDFDGRDSRGNPGSLWHEHLQSDSFHYYFLMFNI